MKRKAQIQIGETVAVLFVFMVLIIISFIFYARVIKSNIESEKEEVSQIKSVGIAQRVMFLPELQCSQDVVTEVPNCIDLLKLESAQKIISANENSYFDLLEFSDITVSQIYPEDTTKVWSIYAKKTANLATKGTGHAPKFVTNVLISLYNPTARRNSFGILTIETLTR